MNRLFLLGLLCIVCLTACKPSLYKMASKQAHQEEGLFRSNTNIEIISNSKRRWFGDSAKVMDPYSLLKESPEGLKALFGPQWDADAWKQIAFVWKDYNDTALRQQKGHCLKDVWKGETLFATGTLERAVSIIPFYSEKRFQKTDSVFISIPNVVEDAQEGRMHAIRKFKFDGRKCVVVFFDQLCHADKKNTHFNYLFFNGNGLLDAAISLEAPCGESMGFSYLKYIWDSDHRLLQVRGWHAGGSEFSEETNASQVDYNWPAPKNH